MHKFVKLSAVSMLAIMAATGANAAGYTCEELIEYTSCNPGYYLATENHCPSGSTYFSGVCHSYGEYYPSTEEDCPNEEEGGQEYMGAGCIIDYDEDAYESYGYGPGFYPLQIGMCTTCPAGSTCAGDTADKVACAAGTYQPNTGQTSCIDAPVGNYVSATGATKYTACSVGQYQPTAGQSSCLPCPAGSYCATTGLSAATGKCNIGTYSTGGETSASCTSCPITALTDINGDTVSATTASTGSTSASACFIDPSAEFKDDTGIYHFKQNCMYDINGVMSYDQACLTYKESLKNNSCGDPDEEGYYGGSECYEIIDCETGVCGDDSHELVYDPDSGNISCWWPGAYGCSVDLYSLKSGCADTGGTWNSNSVSCNCPSGYELTCSSDYYGGGGEDDPYNGRYVCISEEGLYPDDE
ncbi:MAG: hypothetical protein IKB10_02685 [Alphaproteobacteria bacterium]|nr:hypothetical protein [Alphaproteobacteria bacterium]